MAVKSTFRIEHDPLGPVQVPRQALYGAQTARALENFAVSGRGADPALIRAYLRIKASAARANAITGALPRRQARLILWAAEEVLAMPEQRWPALFPVDAYQAGAGTSQNMNVNEVLANLANRKSGSPLGSNRPVHPNDHVNCSQSTNDTYPTAMRLAILELSAGLIAELAALAKALRAKAREFWAIPKSARTHLQDAVPMRLGQEFAAYGRCIERCAGALEQSREGLRELGISGSAAGTGLNVPRGYGPAVLRDLSRRTGEPLRLAPDLCEAMQSQFAVGLYSATLRCLGFEMTRICNDLRLLASGPLTGLGELVLPAVQPGSSIMPGKVNPSIPEMANQAWFSVLGLDQTIAFCLQAGQLELNVMMPMMACSALEASRVAANSTRILRSRCIEGLRADEERCRRYFESTPQVATALSPRLGYERTAALVRESLSSGRSVLDLVRKKRLLSERELATLLKLSSLAGSS